MNNIFVIKKTFKGKTIGTTGVFYKNKDLADKACRIHNNAKEQFSSFLDYKVVQIN